jgi:flagellar biosynthesis/type III secretory pathway protein FliH
MNTRTIVLLVVGLVAAISVVTYFGFAIGKSQGYDIGYLKGNDIGYAKGVPVGYTSGYANGTQIGYTNGYSAGNTAGYGTGYTAGNTDGYAVGYQAGDQTGEATGYASGYQVGDSAGYSNGLTVGNSTGYVSGYTAGFKATGFNIKDPTYKQAMAFMSSDKTWQNHYTTTFDCENFAGLFKKDAFKAGYRCFYVVIDTSGLYGHAIDAFNTTDRGMIYIEPQLNQMVTVKMDTNYEAVNNFVSNGDYVITKILLIP